MRLAAGFAQKGHSVTVATIGSKPKNDILLQQLYMSNISVVHLNCDSKWSVLVAVWRFKSLLRSLSPDIMQSFLYHANVLASLCNVLEIPHFIGLRVKDPRSGRYRRLARYQQSWSGIVCVSEDVRKHVQQYFEISTECIVTIPNGLSMRDVESAKREPWPNDIIDGEEKLVFLGRLDKQKGVDTIIAEMPEMLEHCPKRQLYIIGEGPYRKTIEKAIDNLKHKNRVHLLGYRDDALTLLSHGTILLFPSRWEGMPNVVLEAMALGLPVCATPADGVEELLGHDNGQIATRANWGKALERLLSKPRQQLKAIGEENAKVVSERYSTSKMITQYLSLYEQEAANG